MNLHDAFRQRHEIWQQLQWRQNASLRQELLARYGGLGDIIEAERQRLGLIKRTSENV